MKNLKSNIILLVLIICNGYVYYNIFNRQGIPERKSATISSKRTDKQSVTLKVPVHNDYRRIQE